MIPNGRIRLAWPLFVISAILILFLQQETYGANDDANHPVGNDIIANKKTEVTSMLFTGKYGDKETVSDLTTNDIIIRLQEKYEHTICHSYLKSVPELENQYFQYDTSLLTVEDLEFAEEAKPTFGTRYHLLFEPCNKDNELAFWREMFQVAETDQFRDFQDPMAMAKMMKRWNDVWLKYQDKSVCNQKLLLECITPRPGQEAILQGRNDPALGICECRTREVGLPSIFPVGNVFNLGGQGHFQRIFVSPYYVTATEIENGKEVIVHDEYVLHNRCVAQANMGPSLFDGPLLITNPCDFSLPMIGMCTVGCVHNASCVSVGSEEKQEMRERSGKDWLERVRDWKVHDVYHNKCECEKGKTCFTSGQID